MSGGPGGLGEFGLIRELTRELRSGAGVIQGIGDDCAVIEVGGAQLLLTCDASLEGVHFHRDWGTPWDLGWKAAVSALSDIAAMGGRAKYVLVTIALPDDIDLPFTQALYRGIADAVESAGAVILGGDTTASQSGVVVDITVIGEVVGRAVLRGGARAGDVIAVTGVPGRRGAGLHALLNGIDVPELIRDYLHPTPRLAEGQWLGAQTGVTAMMDVSDGLLPDARHIAESSGVRIDLWPGKLPEDSALAGFWGAQGCDNGGQRLRSGEEYELLVVLAPEAAEGVCRGFREAFGVALTVVGACGAEHAGVWVDGAVSRDDGFEHFR